MHASQGAQDSWIFFGDYITAGAMDHDPRGIGTFSTAYFNNWVTSRVLNDLRAMVFERELKPGDYIDEKALAVRWNISRTPLREALRVLVCLVLAYAAWREPVTSVVRMTPRAAGSSSTKPSSVVAGIRSTASAVNGPAKPKVTSYDSDPSVPWPNVSSGADSAVGLLVHPDQA